MKERDSLGEVRNVEKINSIVNTMHMIEPIKTGKNGRKGLRHTSMDGRLMWDQN